MEAPRDIWKPFALVAGILLALALLLGFALGAAAQPVRKPAVQRATLDWLRARLSIREATRYPGNDGPEVAALIRAGGGDPAGKLEYCGFTQTADQKAHGLPYPGGGMQGAARCWFTDETGTRLLARTFYYAGRRGLLDSIQPGDLVGLPRGALVRHITRAEQVVPPLRKGRPPRGFYCLAGNEGIWPNAGLHRNFYAGSAIRAAARWDY